MLRMKSRKRTKKMRGGGIFGPEFGGHVNKANEQAAYGWGKFLSGVEVGRRESRIARDNAYSGYNANIKPSGTMGGVKSTQSQGNLADKFRRFAIAHQTKRRHGDLGFKVEKQRRARDMGLSDPAKRNPLFSPMKSTLREAEFAARAKATAGEQGYTSDVVNPIKIKFERQVSKGGRKTKKRRRKRKKKKTKRKKRRRKRKTKKRRRKKI